MTYPEFTAKFQSHVAGLNDAHKMELALEICIRLFPDYAAFSIENKWGDPDVLLDAIKLIQYYTQSTSSTDLQDMLAKLETVTPDTNDFEDASYALNACCAIMETLEFLTDNDQSHIVNIGSYLTDTIYFKIQDAKDLSEKEIDAHSLMIVARDFLLGKL